MTTSSRSLASTRPSWWSILVRLFKLRVVSLLLWVALGGALVTASAGPFGPGFWKDLLMVSLAGLLAAGGASALNEYLERDLDAAMRRTRTRPLPAGLLSPRLALVLGILGMGLGIGLGWAYRPMLGVFVAAGAFVYVVVYTLGLKRRSVVNIVVGGAAGSFAVLSGAAAVDRWNHPAAWLLAGLVFLWTPVHFWALALLYRDDYRVAGFPMLPAVTTPRNTARWIALHAWATVFAALALSLFLRRPVLYGLGALLLSFWLLHRVHGLLRHPEARDRARSTFMASNLYLAGLTFWAMLISML